MLLVILPLLKQASMKCHYSLFTLMPVTVDSWEQCVTTMRLIRVPTWLCAQCQNMKYERRNVAVVFLRNCKSHGEWFVRVWSQCSLFTLGNPRAYSRACVNCLRTSPPTTWPGLCLGLFHLLHLYANWSTHYPETVNGYPYPWLQLDSWTYHFISVVL